jgi:hypothetical protein
LHKESLIARFCVVLQKNTIIKSYGDAELFLGEAIICCGIKKRGAGVDFFRSKNPE